MKIIIISPLVKRTIPVKACHALGYNDAASSFPTSSQRHPSSLTLLPFAVMGAITAEAGLSFLGLAKRAPALGVSSWMRAERPFPAKATSSGLPPYLLTLLLVAIALVGDGLRDALVRKVKD